MPRRIIDSHAHLGDIFHENRNITFKTNIKKGDYEDRFRILEESKFTKALFTGDPHDLDLVIDGGQYRCWESTLEQLTAQLDECDMAGIVLLPCLPNTTFEEYLAASKLEPRILPFTGADFSLPPDEMVDKLRRDIGRGAKGLKLHPVLQNVRLTTEAMAAAARVFGEADLPVVVHVGEGTYYHENSGFPWNSKYGAVSDFLEFVHMVPEVKLVAAHCCGLAQVLKDQLGEDIRNVYVDTSFCNADVVRFGVDVLGEDKVLFGTDYPFTYEKYDVAILEDALGDDPLVFDKVCYANIARLLHL